MNSSARRWAMAALVATALAGCGGAGEGASSPTTDEGPVVLDVGVSATTSTVAASPDTTDATGTAPSPDAAPDTAPGTAPTVPTTVAPDPAPAADPATGLAPPTSRTAPPAGAAVDATGGGASLFIEAGSQSYAAGGGTCSEIDGYTYVFVGDLGGRNASLSWNTANPAQGQFLAWRYGESTDTSLISFAGIDADDAPITVTFGADTTTGSFTGWYYLNESQTFWEFEGSFSCAAQPMTVSGAHPVSLLEARCTRDRISAGTAAPADAALLLIDLETPARDGQRVGAMTWRAGGVVYATDWLLVRPTADGLGAGFVGSATGPDGVAFDVEGSFNCLSI